MALVAAFVTPAFGATVIVDNVDPGFSVLYGSWSTYSASGQWGSDYRYTTTSTSATGEVEWRPSVPEAGTYTVSVWYRSTGGSRPNDAHYTIQHNGGVADVYISQQQNGSQWVSLGTYDFSAGTSAYVRLTNQAQNNRTIVADAVKFESLAPPQPEFRGFWADVFHYGLQNAAQIDQMIALAVQGHYNAILPEVLAYHDNQYGSHGAYWRSDIVARSSYVTDTFDPLAYMVQQAHANNLEIHPWLVAFRVSSTWPPPGNAYLAAHPEFLMVPLGSMGSVAPVGSYYTLDPGSPDVQEYLVSIVTELVTNYAIDGIHWDYIRYTQKDAGYPADTSYPKSSLARFQQITGYSGTPSTSYGPWDDFRRRTITELVRRVRAEIPTITSNPRQPVRYTAALVTWYPASTDFHQTRPYYETLCDWEYWASKGYLDATIPMCYFDEDGSYAQTYRDWVDNSVTWAYDRQTFIGPGIYMNSFANSVVQMDYARNAQADGLCTYSYASTNDTGTTWTDWYPYVASNLFNTSVPTPAMPWRDPATAVDGTLFGQVTDGTTGEPVDDATVQVDTLPSVQTDGNGYYVVTLIPASGSGTAYDVTASKSGMPTVVVNGVTVIAGDVQRQDIVLTAGTQPPVITVQPVSQSACTGESVQFSVAATGDGPLSYQWYRNDVALDDAGGEYTGTHTDTLTIVSMDPAYEGDFHCVVSNAGGDTASDPAGLAWKPDTVITLQPTDQQVPAGGSVVIEVHATGAGVLSHQWQKEGGDLADGGHYSGVQTDTLTVSDCDASVEGAYQCVVTGGCGVEVSDPATLTLSPYGDFDGDGDVDLSDYGDLLYCYNGPNNPLPVPGCDVADSDGDGDVDLTDYGAFLGCYNGPNNPPGC
jgi:uncharacterized lipoprotein YddW (UPF0748 family)